MRVPIAPRPHQHAVASDLGPSGGVQWRLVITICIFPVTCDAEPLFHVLIYQPLIFGEASVKVFDPFFLIKLYVFFLMTFKSSSYILDNSPLSEVFFRKYFLSVRGLSSNSLHVVFHGAVFVLVKSAYQLFLSWFVLQLKSRHRIQGHLGILLCCPPGVSQF